MRLRGNFKFGLWQWHVQMLETQKDCYRKYKIASPKIPVSSDFPMETSRWIFVCNLFPVQKFSAAAWSICLDMIQSSGFTAPFCPEILGIKQITSKTHLKGICTVSSNECCYGLIVAILKESTQSICGQPQTVSCQTLWLLYRSRYK